MDYVELLTVVLSCTVPTAALIVTIFALRENMRKRNAETVTVNRLDWLSAVREILTEFAIIYKLHPGEKDKLKELEIKLLMYTRWDKAPHHPIQKQIGICSTVGYNENDYKKLILLSQYELAKAWHRVGAECTQNMKSGGKHEPKMAAYLKNETKELLEMYERLN